MVTTHKYVHIVDFETLLKSSIMLVFVWFDVVKSIMLIALVDSFLFLYLKFLVFCHHLKCLLMLRDVF